MLVFFSVGWNYPWTWRTERIGYKPHGWAREYQQKSPRSFERYREIKNGCKALHMFQIAFYFFLDHHSV